MHILIRGPERGGRRNVPGVLLARRFLLELDLKLMNKPVKSFLYNVNADDPKISCKLV
jgi:hypothetical protein